MFTARISSLLFSPCLCMGMTQNSCDPFVRCYCCNRAGYIDDLIEMCPIDTRREKKRREIQSDEVRGGVGRSFYL